MQELREQRITESFIIADVVVNGKIVGWSVTDKQLQRVTEEIFKTAALAFEWIENKK